MRGNNVMLGYHDDPEGTAHAFRGGWFHSGDLAVWHPGRHDRAARPRQGRDHLGRREHLDDRGRADAGLASRGARVRRDRDPARALGRAPEGLRDAARGRRGDAGGADRALPRSASRTSRRPTRSSSARCRRPRPARCRSTCCAIASGAIARRASTEARSGEVALQPHAHITIVQTRAYAYGAPPRRRQRTRADRAQRRGRSS